MPRAACWIAGLGLALLLLGARPAVAQTADLDRQVREIASSLRCPVCQNLSVADSPSPLAAGMRAVIRTKLQAGGSRAAITQYFVDRYGESILLDPPAQGFSLLIWLGALGAILGGGLLLAARLRGLLSGAQGRARPAPAGGNRPAAERPALAPADRDRYEAALDAALLRYQQGEPEW